MKFKPGQKIVCTGDGTKWIHSIDISQLTFWERIKLFWKGNKAIGPQFNEVVTVAHKKQNPGGVPLVEYRSEVFGQYVDAWFEPLVKTEVLENELAEIFSSEKDLRQN